MAKKKKATKDVQTVNDDMGFDGETVDEVISPGKVPTIEEPGIHKVSVGVNGYEDPNYEVTISVPLRGQYSRGPGHVDAQLNRKQANILWRIVHGLDQGHFRLANNRHVHTKADAIRWMIEYVGEQDENARKGENDG